MSISIRTTPQKMFPLLVPSVAESARAPPTPCPQPFIVSTMPAKPSLAALEKQFETERVRTKVLELWREGNLSINHIAKHKDVAKAKSTVQYNRQHKFSYAPLSGGSTPVLNLGNNFSKRQSWAEQ